MTASSGVNQQPEFEAPPNATRRLFRSQSNRVFAGVCGGIAEYFNADPTAVRLLTVIVALFTAIFPVLFVYLIAAIIVPVRTGIAGDQPAFSNVNVTPGQGGLILGIVLVGIGIIALANETLRINWDVLWPVGVIVLGAAIVLAAQQRR